MTESKPIENSLFTWKRWDEHDIMCFKFSEVTLLATFGEFSVGTKFSYLLLDFEHSRISLYNYGGVCHNYALTLKVGEEL